MHFFTDIDLTIRARTSWRTFEPVPIPIKKKEEMIHALSDVTHTLPFHSKLRFEFLDFEDINPKETRKLGTYGMIKGARSFIVGAVQKSEKALFDYGYALELLILKATELELGTCWLGSTFRRSDFAHRINLQPTEILPAITPIGIRSKRNIKGKSIRTLIRAKRRKPFENLFFKDNFGQGLHESEVEIYKNAFKWLQLAPSGGNRQKWRCLFLSDTKIVHFFIDRTSESPTGGYWNIQKLDMGIAMAHFDRGCKDQKLSGYWKLEPSLKLMDPIPHDFEYCFSWIPKQ